jgi:hypothetical protein
MFSFVEQLEGVRTIISLYQAGIINRDEARQALAKYKAFDIIATKAPGKTLRTRG